MHQQMPPLSVQQLEKSGGGLAVLGK